MSDGAPEGSDLELPAGDDDTLDDPQDLLDRVKRAQALHDGGDSGADSVSGTGEGAAGPEMHEAPDDDHTVIPDDATLSRLRISLAESRAQASSEPSGSEERTIGGGGSAIKTVTRMRPSRAPRPEQPPKTPNSSRRQRHREVAADAGWQSPQLLS